MGSSSQPRTYAGVMKLREKRLANGQRSPYLDVYRSAKRTYEFLRLYLTGDKATDAATIRLAETIRAQREIEVQSSDRGLTPVHIGKADFIEYAERLARQMNHSSWRATVAYLRSFSGGVLLFEQLTPAKLDDLNRGTPQ